MTARDRLVAAAFELFARQGFEATTVDQIAAEAQVGRTTFFRIFPTKEAVVFPDHSSIQAAVDTRLDSASAATGHVALLEASRIVLDHYLAEGPVARARYALTSTIPALRSVEAAGQRGYQRIFREHALRWGRDPLDAELVAAGVVTAHNHVLRRWLRQEADDPHAELAAAFDRLRDRRSDGEAETGIILLRSTRDLDVVVQTLRDVLADEG